MITLLCVEGKKRCGEARSWTFPEASKVMVR